jgi:hypothetical protein
MLSWIIAHSVMLCNFVAAVGLPLSKPQRRHVLNVSDALVMSDAKHKTLEALQRELVEPPTSGSALAACFREGPWEAVDLRTPLIRFLLAFAIHLARTLKLEKTINASFDDSICVKDGHTRCLEGVAFHHDHAASTKKTARYVNGSVYVACHVQIGWLQFTVNWRLYLREATLRQLNRRRPAERRVKYYSKVVLVQQMLEELAPHLPADFMVYVLFDSWYSGHQLIKFIRAHGWHAIGGLKANRCVDQLPLRQWWQALQTTPMAHIALTAQDGFVRTYLVRDHIGRLQHLAEPVRVLVSKTHRRDKSPAYFFCTDLVLMPDQVLERYQSRWGCEVDNWYLKTQLGLADYRLQSLDAIEKYHAVVFLTLAYLQWRLICRRRDAPALPRENVADMIRLHRYEHQVKLITAVVTMAQRGRSLTAILARFVRAVPAAGLATP